MDDLVTDYAGASNPETFWANLVAVLTDEVVIVEAQAVGMDWPEFAEGRRRLVATRHAILAVARDNGWVLPGEAAVLEGEDPRAALAAARPQAEHGQLISLDTLDEGGAG